MLEVMENLLKEKEADIIDSMIIAHAGDGNLHGLLLFDPHDEHQVL